MKIEIQKIIKKIGKKIAEIGLDFALPNTGACLNCGEEGAKSGLCEACRQQLDQEYIGKRAEYPSCTAFSKYAYQNFARVLVMNYKFYDKRYLHELIAKEMQDMLPSNLEFDYITCVPLHRKREKERGYNQTYLLAKNIATMRNIPYADLLIRHKYTQPQSLMKSKEERAKNIQGAFSPVEGIVLTGKRVLLVDDIITTGATIESCAKVLKNMGAEEIIALSFAHA